MSDFYLFNKKVLFIGTGFYDYDQSIIKEMINQGGSVEYLSTIINSTTYRIKKKIGLKKSAYRQQLKELKSKVSKLRDNNDIIFVIKGENLNEELIDTIFNRNPEANRILYFWDDVARIDNLDLLLKNFSNIYSFDSEDCKKWGFRFRPLFYRNNIISEKRKYYMSSVAGLHSDRLSLFRIIADIMESKSLVYNLKLVTSRYEYYMNKYILHTIQSLDSRIISIHPFTFKEVEEIMAKSQCILDSPHTSQKGLTIRTIEALRAGCHVFTTNSYISEYKDISPEYYTIIDKNNIHNIEFKEEYPTSKLSNRYSLNKFLFELLNDASCK